MPSVLSSCASSVASYFRDPPKKNHITQFFASSKGRDSLVKLFSALSESAYEIIKVTDANASVKQGFQTGSHGFKDARTVFGLLNVLDGSFPMLYTQARNVATYTMHFFRGEDIPVKAKKHHPDTTELGKVILRTGKEYSITQQKKQDPPTGTINFGEGDKFLNAGSPPLLKAPLEKILLIIGEIGRVVQTTTYSVAFGICRPILFAEKHFKEHISQSAHAIGQQFGLLMMICHMAGVVSGIADISREGIFYLKSGRLEDDWNELVAVVWKQALFLLEKFCEIGSSSISLFRLNAHVGVRLSLMIGAASLGVYKAWQDTAV